jgi:hypothetical protein
VLSGLAVCAAVTAVIAGITGAWSPCGFSMVETIGSAMGDARRAATLAASTTFALGAVIGGAVTFGGLALVGRLVAPGAGGLRDGIGASLALAAAIADWRGVKIAPQIRRQVPERWRWRAPLALACGLYGILLGLAFTTFVLTFAVWALAGISFAAGDPALGVLVGVAFGLGRALPVLVMAPSLNGGGGRRLDGMASEPRMWLGLRRLDAIGLSMCALFLSAAGASAAVFPAESDPSASGEALAWEALSGQGMLGSRGAQATVLPGGFPALGGSSIAWETGGQITVATLPSMTVTATLPVVGLNALALSESWVVYRDRGSAGEENLIAVPLAVPLAGAAQRRYIAGSKLAGQIGRPSLDGSRVLYTVDTPQHSEIVMVNLLTGKRTVVRSAEAGIEFLNPSLLEGRLLYERFDRCSQQLLIGSPATARANRVIVSLPSTALRDPGYEAEFTHAYNTASLCPNRRTGAGSTVRLGPTALSASTIYVTEVPSNPDEAQILTTPR